MTAKIIEFRTKATYPDSNAPTFTIDIYDIGGDHGFSWVVCGEGDAPPDREALLDYLGDMFLSLAGEDAEPEPPSILKRTRTFIRNLFHGDDK